MKLISVGIVVVVISLLYVRSVEAVLGVDISQPTCASMTQEKWNCLKNGRTFAIIEGMQGGYGVGQHTPTCVTQARAAGFEYVDIYAFLCPNCHMGSAKNAITELVNFLRSHKVNFGMIWLDVEQCQGCWNDKGSNAAFVKEAAGTLRSLGVHYGIYSSMYEWGQTVGGATIDPGAAQWYAHWDNEPAFNDPNYWKFGGWTTPAIKQYHGGISVCGVDVDLDYY